MGGSEDAIVVWFPLTNVTRELGALEVVPGSHTRGLLTSRFLEGFGLVDCYEDKDFVSVPLGMGDALFFNSYLVHRSGNNVTDNIRWSCHFRYNNLDDTTFINKKYPHPYIYTPTTKGAV
jgi:ectoine hydroxylase-related dioxygenase (phytanoyl-CoA dioxygenase family)